MAIKNKRTSIVSQSTIDKRLKNKLKEDFNAFLHEDDEDDLGAENPDTDSTDLSDDSSLDDMGDDTSTAPDETQIDDPETDDEYANLKPTEKQWMDQEVDELLEPNLEGEEDDISLDEADEDLSIEDSADNVGDDISGDEDISDFNGDDSDLNDEHDLPGGFSADELNAIIDSPYTIDALKTDLVHKAENLDDNELDGLDDDSDDLGMGGDDDSDELTEAAIASSLSEIGFNEDDADTEGEYGTKFPESKSAPSADGKASVVTKDGFQKEAAPKTETVPSSVTESIKKSKMLVKAAEMIDKLQEANKKLKLENTKLNKVNGILTVIGDKLSKPTRKKISESFAKCKNEAEINKLYSDVAKIANKQKSTTSLNEAVQRKKVGIKTTNVLKESNKENKPSLPDEQKRINYLMGMSGFDDSYFK